MDTSEAKRIIERVIDHSDRPEPAKVMLLAVIAEALVAMVERQQADDERLEIQESARIYGSK